ncbi:MAG: membrane protein insertion efficiency factor YidD [Legionellales bacterium]|nr:membrane protein insertion efficiency factor YidD [Legionellales bacterium]
MGQIMRKMMCVPIRSYQYVISPFIRSCCRFYPSCSQYAILAIETHGIIKGLWMATRRLLRCHPFSEGGFDPVSPTQEKP